MRDTCAACGRPVYTVRAQGFGITLAQQWTHGSRRVDRQHAVIPSNHEYQVVRRRG